MTKPEEVLFVEFDSLRARFQGSNAVKHISNLCNLDPEYKLVEIIFPILGPVTGYRGSPYMNFAVTFCINRGKTRSEGYLNTVTWYLQVTFPSRREKFRARIPGRKTKPRVRLRAAFYMDKDPLDKPTSRLERSHAREIGHTSRYDYVTSEHMRKFLPNVALLSEAIMADMLSFSSLEELVNLHSEAFTAIVSSDENTLKENHHD